MPHQQDQTMLLWKEGFCEQIQVDLVNLSERVNRSIETHYFFLALGGTLTELNIGMLLSSGQKFHWNSCHINMLLRSYDHYIQVNLTNTKTISLLINIGMHMSSGPSLVQNWSCTVKLQQLPLSWLIICVHCNDNQWKLTRLNMASSRSVDLSEETWTESGRPARKGASNIKHGIFCCQGTVIKIDYWHVNVFSPWSNV